VPTPSEVIDLIERFTALLTGLQQLNGFTAAVEAWPVLFRDADAVVKRLHAKLDRDPSAAFPATSLKES
jgi:hypothetical protein